MNRRAAEASPPPATTRRRCAPSARAAVFALAALVGGTGLPLVALALAADDPAPLCCGRGRCCCAGHPASPDERTCVSRACGCGHGDAATAAAPARLEAVLTAARLPTAPVPRLLPRSRDGEVPLSRPHDPPVPPPRRRPAA